MSNSEITPHEDSEGTPIRLESISSTPQRRQDGVRSEAAYEEGTLSELTSAVTSTYTSFANFLNKGATDLTEATKKLPSQFQNLAAGGTSMVTKLTGGLTDFIAHGIPGLAEDHFQEPSFEALQKIFGLANSDSLIGCFVYIQVSFPVMVSVTENVLCFTVERSGSDYADKIPSNEIVGLSSESDLLVLNLTDDRQVVFKNFGSTEAKVRAFKLMQSLATR